ncbi:MAG: hypothetical protein PHU47_00900 [Candidatus ainarchaeum sp.]|nr:hypothetical protein [Candidatus ainarchaeum sp.]
MLTEVGKKKRGPRALVEFFYNKVDVFNALGVVFLVILLNIIFYIIVKIPKMGLQILADIYSSVFVSWFILGLLIFLTMYFIRSSTKLPKRPLEKVLSALASFRIPVIIYGLFSFMIVLLFFPNLITLMQSVFLNPAIIASETFLPTLTTVNYIGLGLLLLFTIVFFIYIICMMFAFVETVYDVKNFFGKLGLVILLLILISFVSWVFGLAL